MIDRSSRVARRLDGRRGRLVSAPSVRATVAAVLVGVITMTPAFLTGALGLQLRAELGLGQAGLGLAVSAFFLVTALSSPLLGGVADRLGAVRGLRVAGLIMTFTMLGVALAARSGPVFVACLAVAGLANGIGGPTASLLISRHVVRRPALAFGLKQAAVPATTLLAGLAVPLIALTVGWRWAFAGAGVVAAAVALGARHASDDRPSWNTPRDAQKVAAGSLLLVVVAFGFATATATALSSFLVDLGVERGLSEGQGGVLLAAISVVAITARVGAGWHADRPHVDPFRLSLTMQFLGLAGFLLLAFASGALSVVVGAALAFGGGWGWTGLMSYVATRGNPRVPATAAGLLQTGGASGGILGPFAAGLILEHASHQATWTVVAVFALVSGTALWLASRSELGVVVRATARSAAEGGV